MKWRHQFSLIQSSGVVAATTEHFFDLVRANLHLVKSMIVILLFQTILIYHANNEAHTRNMD